MEKDRAVLLGSSAFASSVARMLEHSVDAAHAQLHAAKIVKSLLENGANAQAKLVHMQRRVRVPFMLLELVLRFPSEECATLLSALTLLVVGDADIADDMVKHRGLSVVQHVLSRSVRARVSPARPAAAALALMRALLQNTHDKARAASVAARLSLHKLIVRLLRRGPEPALWRDALVALALVLCRPAAGGTEFVTAAWDIHPGTAVETLNAGFVSVARRALCSLQPARHDDALTALCHCLHAIAIADTRGFIAVEGFHVVVALLASAETPRLLEAVFALLYSTLTGGPADVVCELEKANALSALLGVLALAPTSGVPAWLFVGHAYLLAVLTRSEDWCMMVHTAPETATCLSSLRWLSHAVRITFLERAKARFEADVASSERGIGEESIARVAAHMNRIASFSTVVLLMHTAEMGVMNALMRHSDHTTDDIVFKKAVLFRPLHVLAEVKDSPMTALCAAQVLILLLRRGCRTGQPHIALRLAEVCRSALSEPVHSHLKAASVSTFGLLPTRAEAVSARAAVRSVLSELRATLACITADAVD
jgi:hypothetical protein